MSTTISQALAKRFDKHRIVFWYDITGEMRDEFDAADLQDVEKIVLENNEFSVKHRILKEQPSQRFLLYQEGPKPDHIDNWLLDVLLAHDQFRADKVGMWLLELELEDKFADFVTRHSAFFNAVKRRDALKAILNSTDTEDAVALKMMAVTVKADPLFESVVERLLGEHAEKKSDLLDLLTRYGLDACLWSKLQQEYGYQVENPNFEDFAICLFENCFAENIEADLEQKKTLSSNACVFFKRWKNHVKHAPAFEKLSDYFDEEVLCVKDKIRNVDFRALLEADTFRVIDKKILQDLIDVTLKSTASEKEIVNWVAKRKESYWYNDVKHLYKAVEYAAQFFAAVDGIDFHYENMDDAVHNYTSSWYKIDFFYRKYTYHAKTAAQPTLLNALSEKINGIYSNTYLLELNDRWQQQIDAVTDWAFAPEKMQRRFFRTHVLPFLKQNKKVCVIISDGLRYEAGAELQRLIRKEDRFEAHLHTGVSMLPSYTQLGMASLLPSKDIEIKSDESSTVLVDGKTTRGTEARRKILSDIDGKIGTAVTASELIALNQSESRALFNNHDVVYVYHDVIDSTGDKGHTEEMVFDAVERCHEELLKLIKKLVNANASNLFVTADHGFIYQDNQLDESEYSSAEIVGDEVLFKDRRFVLGKGLVEHSGLKKFTALQLGLAGDIEVLLPKSINRLGNKGAGSRYVHGGASLQEVVVPVLHINKKRKGDVSQVEVEILTGSVSTITTGQHSIVFYQTEAVTDKVHARELRAGLYAQDGRAISDEHTLVFDNPSTNVQDRERKQQFILSSTADEENGKEVYLKLEERHGKTNRFKTYRQTTFRLQRSIGSDFGFDF